jgi:hypothetical protein
MEEQVAFIFKVEVPPKHWYPSSILQDVTAQNTKICTHTAVGTSTLKIVGFL